MKKNYFLLITLCMFLNILQAQVTNLGTGSGTGGINGTYVGYYSGNVCTAFYNSFFGAYSGRNASTGNYNTGLGAFSLMNNTTGYNNVATGVFALYSNSGGRDNIASGFAALYSNSTGTDNIANGNAALYKNSTGFDNIALGNAALNNNGTGAFNIATGRRALYSNLSGTYNIATGYNALHSNTDGNNNIAAGVNALYSNSTGTGNIASGFNALYNNTTSNYNIATGEGALYNNTTGSANIASGSNSLYRNTTGYNNVATGSLSLYYNTTGYYNTAAGYFAGTSSVGTYSNTTALGWAATASASNQVRIGNSSVTDIGGQVSWSTLSDGRFKKDIKEDVAGLDFIKKLRPVSYAVDKPALDKSLGLPDSVIQRVAETRNLTPETRQTGFIAQEVEALAKKGGYVISAVQAPQNDNDHYSIRYAEFVIPLVKAVQELSAKVEEQQKAIELLSAQLNNKAAKSSASFFNPADVVLFQNAPNPFSTDTEIKMKLPNTAGRATIIIYAMDGKELKSIPVNDRGDIKVKVSGYALTAGMYIYALLVDNKVIDSKQMVLTR